MTLSDAYKTLGIPEDASPEDAKAAYRRLVNLTHPDRGGSAADFIRVRAAYEIVRAFLHQGPADEEVPVPEELRAVIDGIVTEFRGHLSWAEDETKTHLAGFERRMRDYVQGSQRAELRRFSGTFKSSWNATIERLFAECNERSDRILESYESWYSEATQQVFDQMYLKELRSFARQKRFYLYLTPLLLIALSVAAVLSAEGGLGHWIAAGWVVAAAVALAFLAYRSDRRHKRRYREKVELLSVAPFSLDDAVRFQTEQLLQHGQWATATLGRVLGDALVGGPVVGAAAGLILGGVLDRVFNPTNSIRASLDREIRGFMAAAQPQVLRYVLEAHQSLLNEVSGRIVTSYQKRTRDTVKLLTAG